MRRLLKLLVLIVLLTPVVALALVWFALSSQPAVTARAELSTADVERAKAVLKAGDPRGKPAGSEQRLQLSERDVNVALDYAFRKYGRGAARVEVGANRLRAVGSMRLPFVPLRPYVNIESTIETDNGAPRISGLSVGAVPIPSVVAGGLLRVAAERVFGVSNLDTTAEALRELRLSPGQVAVRYRWEPDTVRTLGTQLAGVNPEALAAYHARLLALQESGALARGSVAPALAPLFALARERSANSNPVAENRALLLVLGAWASGRSTRLLVPQAPREPQPMSLLLNARRDLAQHFLVSAALAAASDTRVSDVIGLHKEMSDSRGGSGFSFVDLVADRAGTRFGELASSSDGAARRVQDQMSRGVPETDIMPKALNLPEGMQEAEFRRRYQAVGSPEYRRLADEIERRVASCAMYRR